MTKPELEAELAAVRRELGERRRVGDMLAVVALNIGGCLAFDDSVRRAADDLCLDWRAIRRCDDDRR